MPGGQSNAYRLHDSFQQDLRNVTRLEGLKSAMVRLLRTFNAETAAVVTSAAPVNMLNLAVTVEAGRPMLWPDYVTLCRSNREPLSRLLRLSPYPVALSDLRQNPRLLARSHDLFHLLARQAMDDIFAVRVAGHASNFSMMLIAGRNLRLRPTNRHLLALVAADIVTWLHEMLTEPSGRPPAPHLQLTSRQMEIANWLVAGKTDWEIGEILNISSKTVNFHVENIKRIYGVKSRNQFVAAIVNDGGLRPVGLRPVGMGPIARPRKASGT